MINLIKMLICE